jgi:hypothetical protein
MNFNLLLIGFFILLFSACKKELPKENEQEDSIIEGVIVLNEGLFQQNNSSISWVIPSKNEVNQDVFLSRNNRLLGDTGNDIQRYGGKVYVVVTTSSTIEILDAKSFQSIKQIPMYHDGVSQQPRNIVFYEGKAYISSFDGYINVLDTLTNTITSRIAVGDKPDHLIVSNGQLFVSNSGGLNSPEMDSTVTSIDLNTHEVTHTYIVGKNPGQLVDDGEAGLYVVKRGDYMSIPSELIRIDLLSQIVENTGIPATSITKQGDDILVVNFNSITHDASVDRFSCSSKTIVASNVLDLTNHVETLHGIYSQSDGSILVLDAMNYTNQGYIRFYDDQGNYYKSIPVGLNPSKILNYE